MAFEGILGLGEELSHAATSIIATTTSIKAVLVIEAKNYYEIGKAGHARAKSRGASLWSKKPMLK